MTIQSNEPRPIKTLGIGKQITSHLNLKVTLADHWHIIANQHPDDRNKRKTNEQSKQGHADRKPGQ
jgi:hypothetical protein